MVAGSSLGWAPSLSGLRQATEHLCVSVTKQYNLVLAMRGDLFGWETNCGPVESNGSLPPGLFMTNVTCRLTAKKLGSAACPMLVVEYGTTFLMNLRIIHFTLSQLQMPLNEWRVSNVANLQCMGESD